MTPLIPVVMELPGLESVPPPQDDVPMHQVSDDDALSAHEPQALIMLAKGLPISRTLASLANVAAHLQHNSRCAILLLNQGRFVLAAELDLRPADHAVLSKISSLCGVTALTEFGMEHCAEVRPLVTQSAELVGVIVVFGYIAALASEKKARQLDEICLIATLAIEQRHLAEELSYHAHHDPLTHLWNRTWMEQEIAHVLEAAAESGRLTGLIQIGVDAFRLFNELLGREAGHQLLRLIAHRLIDALDPGFPLARTGGDEFLILMPNLFSAAQITSLADRLRSVFDEPFLVDNHELMVRASLGTASSQPGECNANEIQNRADRALLFAKRFSRGGISFYSPDMAKTPPERLVMERHLRFALHKREFTLQYQPQVNLITGKMIGMESLLRWKHASLGYISPAVFVPVAEEIGIISEVGEWVLDEAIRQLEVWQKDGLQKVRLAVNVSPLQFASADFASLVARRLRVAKIDPNDLELEVTETTLMTNFQHGAQQLKQLRALGVQIALDDFGTGHSSLAYLQQLPIDRLKIDRVFVKDIVSSQERPTLLSSIIQMGHSIGCKVIAEGIETAEQALALAAMNCEEAQGFLFSKPLNPSDLPAWAATH